MSHCENCGTRMWGNNACPNCDEELCIVEYQSEFIDRPLSIEFQEKVKEQEKRREDREC